MTSTAIRPPYSTLLRAIEARDVAAIHSAFTPDAAIHDEGEIVHGPAGVERWATRVLGYSPTFTVEEVSEDADETVLTTTVSGEFPGSPLIFHWRLTFAGERIASLRIAA